MCTAFAALSCTPDLDDDDPLPEAMEFELEAQPPRIPEPTALVVNPQTGRIDFSLAGRPLPEDCDDDPLRAQAQCEFDRYLESLDGYPTVSPARAPVTAPLDPASLTPGSNIVIVGARSRAAVNDVGAGFDPATRSLVLRPSGGWAVGEFYWIGVRGYEGGVRAADGRQVVGAPAHALLKQESSLTCGATTPAALPPRCPTLALVSRPDRSFEESATALFRLEAVRQAYVAGGGFQLMQAHGLPREEVAVLWGFPVHSASVAELDPSTGVAPRLNERGELRVRVRGSLDPDSVAPLGPGSPGSVALIDLSAAADGDLAAALPPLTASYERPELVVVPEEELDPTHLYGLFFTRGLRDAQGEPLVPAPVSKLLTLEGELVDEAGNSTVSSVSNAEAASLENGRRALAQLFDDPVFGAATGLTREALVYCFAFTPGSMP